MRFAMDLVSIPANPVPPDASVAALRTPDGVTLRVARWPAPPGRPRGTICLLQGRAEFVEKYFETIGHLQRRGFAVVTFDWRGQGLSQRMLPDARKGHVGSFAEYDADLAAVMEQVVLGHCPGPYFAVSHSMGGVVLIRAAESGKRWFDRMVLAAPMIALNGRGAVALARSSARLMRLFGMGTSYVPGGGATSVSSLPFEGNFLTSDPVRYARTGAIVEARPEVGLGAPTVAWLDAAYQVMDTFADPLYAMRLQQPMLLLGAGQDAVVSTPAAEEFALRTRAGSHAVIAGARHEIMMERPLFQEQFWAAFDAFVPGSVLVG